jgi:hypothetical protein
MSPALLFLCRVAGRCLRRATDEHSSRSLRPYCRSGDRARTPLLKKGASSPFGIIYDCAAQVRRQRRSTAQAISRRGCLATARCLSDESRTNRLFPIRPRFVRAGRHQPVAEKLRKNAAPDRHAVVNRRPARGLRPGRNGGKGRPGACRPKRASRRHASGRWEAGCSPGRWRGSTGFSARRLIPRPARGGLACRGPSRGARLVGRAGSSPSGNDLGAAGQRGEPNAYAKAADASGGFRPKSAGRCRILHAARNDRAGCAGPGRSPERGCRFGQCP